MQILFQVNIIYFRNVNVSSRIETIPNLYFNNAIINIDFYPDTISFNKIYTVRHKAAFKKLLQFIDDLLILQMSCRVFISDMSQ